MPLKRALVPQPPAEAPIRLIKKDSTNAWCVKKSKRSSVVGETADEPDVLSQPSLNISCWLSHVHSLCATHTCGYVPGTGGHHKGRGKRNSGLCRAILRLEPPHRELILPWWLSLVDNPIVVVPQTPLQEGGKGRLEAYSTVIVQTDEFAPLSMETVYTAT